MSEPAGKKTLVIGLQEAVEERLVRKGEMEPAEHLDALSFRLGAAAGMAYIESLLRRGGQDEAADFLVAYVDVSLFCDNAGNN
jgi:hypothetical protein